MTTQFLSEFRDDKVDLSEIIHWWNYMKFCRCCCKRPS